MTVDLDRGPTYGDTLTYSEKDKPALTLQKVHAQIDVDPTRLEQDLIALFGAPTPRAANPRPLPAQ